MSAKLANVLGKRGKTVVARESVIAGAGLDGTLNRH
jgi:hypothetical protein